MKIKFNLRFIIVFLLVIFKYLKMQNFISNTISNCILLATLFIVLIWLGSKGKIKNINTNYFLILPLMAVVQIVLVFFNFISNCIYDNYCFIPMWNFRVSIFK